ncbi:MAG: hypothetical protein A3B10_02360 [Candidatus Doudnabacteria bacterium RIFCSPLOWO2_01_FULL_44_21]|uniref:Uncharacterized protein n=1 Tax=Candidatus Doudnabacteria bacterium RIFCSPLOWO2_01_FULL_44_21 TaxID=1817841 RepID=A0A1F5PX34_9BACT|nr:MAG: hypothetical protein A3B95_02695 [Candidatus Doudnabacteria bacterium RIFCSPHIGHO2_02_FULL_43_13b]OGE94479.1 MAG: hypothetical protein A3B10_02360 [Candidatus Doudnabacteria bacterium RIFCSPLOWO2_01_FULL_44_21]
MFHKNNNSQEGISTIEILVAFAMIVLCISAVILVVFGNQTISADAQTNNEALLLAQAELEKAQLDGDADYDSVQTASLADVDIYSRDIIIDPASVTQCGKNVISSVTWPFEQRSLYVDLTTRITDVVTALAMGGNCDNSPPPPAGWNPPETWNCDNFNPGKPTGLDSLNQVIYMTGNKTPFLYIADTNGIPKDLNCQAHSGDLFVEFDNGFDAGKALNDIKVVRLSDGRIYAFVARDTTPGELQVIDVTDIKNPVSVTILQLLNVSGALSEAFRIYYYDDRIYVTTREATGNEFHIFNASDPTNIYEMGNATQLNTTVESFAVNKKGSSYIAYMAADSNSKELLVYDVTDSNNVFELTNARRNLPGNQDGASISLIGNYLYFGRLSAEGSDFYIFDASDPVNVIGGLPILNQANIDTSVIGIAVSGIYAYLATTKANAEFQVWTSNPSQAITKVNTIPFNFPNVIENGVKYDSNWVYVASQGQDALRILYNGL